MRYGSMKVTQMPPVYAANLVANSGNTAYGVDIINLEQKGCDFVDHASTNIQQFRPADHIFSSDVMW